MDQENAIRLRVQRSSLKDNRIHSMCLIFFIYLSAFLLGVMNSLDIEESKSIENCHFDTDRLGRLSDCHLCPENHAMDIFDEGRCVSLENNPSHGSDALPKLLPGQAMALYDSLPPTLYGSSCILGGKAIVLGGMAYTSYHTDPVYRPMDIAYTTTTLASWKSVKLVGQVPSVRAHACLISMGDSAVFVGGDLANNDAFVYILNAWSLEWIRKKPHPHTINLSACAKHQSHVYIYGGYDRSKRLTSDIWKYDSYWDSWEFLTMTSVGPKLLHAQAFIWRDILHIVGGDTGMPHSDAIYRISLENLEWEMVSINIHERWSFSDDLYLCMLKSRRYFAMGVYDNEFHVFGGEWNDEALQDLIVISLDTLEVIERRSYWLETFTLPLRHPPPKSGSTYIQYNNYLLIAGGLAQNGVIGNDAWIWDAALRRWVDSSSVHMPIHRHSTSIAASNDGNYALFGGATAYYDDIFLNDLWIFQPSERKWTRLFRGSSSEGPSPRLRAILGIYQDRVYVAGGDLLPSQFDDKLWEYNKESNRWRVVALNSLLSENHRPFLRQGVAFIQLDHQLMIWGGQLPNGLRKNEYYNSMIVLDMKSLEIKPTASSDAHPLKRKYAAFCPWSEGQLLLYGGIDFLETPFDESWTYNLTSNKWNNPKSHLAPRGKIAFRSCVNLPSGTVMYGEEKQSFNTSLWLVNPRSESRMPLHMDDEYQTLRGISRATISKLNGAILGFFGGERKALTNQVFMYQPGFCSPLHPVVLHSKRNLTMFEDGSSSAPYISGSYCRWHLPNATHILMNHTLAESDRLYIRPYDKSRWGDFNIHIASGSDSSVMVRSSVGFEIVLQAAADQRPEGSCSDCDGFIIQHIACPDNSDLNPETLECECNFLYVKYEKGCRINNTFLGFNAGSLFGVALRILTILYSMYGSPVDPYSVEIATTSTQVHIYMRENVFGPCVRSPFRRCS